MNGCNVEAPPHHAGSSRVDALHCSKMQESSIGVGRPKSLFVGNRAPTNKQRPPVPSTLPIEIPASVTPKGQPGRASNFLLKVELRQTDGSFPPFPGEMLTQTHPLIDVDAHRQREKNNYKRQYLRAVKRFTRRLKRMPSFNQQMQAFSSHHHHQQQHPTHSTTSLTVTVPTAPSTVDSGTNASISMFNRRSTKLSISHGSKNASTDAASATVAATFLTNIRAEIRLVVRRSLVANLRARHGKVRRAVFNSIVEEMTDAVFVHWQEPMHSGMPIRTFLNVSAFRIHTAIDKHLNVLFGTGSM